MRKSGAKQKLAEAEADHLCKTGNKPTYPWPVKPEPGEEEAGSAAELQARRLGGQAKAAAAGGRCPFRRSQQKSGAAAGWTAATAGLVIGTSRRSAVAETGTGTAIVEILTGVTEPGFSCGPSRTRSQL